MQSERSSFIILHYCFWHPTK